MTDSPFKIDDHVRFLKKIGPGLAGCVGSVRIVNPGEDGGTISVRIVYNHQRRPFQFTVSAQPVKHFELVTPEEIAELEAENDPTRA